VEDMKQFANYQYIPGEPMTDRDKQEVGSKFWNEGKWENFVLPFLPNDCSDMTLVDMGCNAGLFLKLAEDKGFGKVIGIDSNREAINKAIAYREKNNGTYDIQRRSMQRTIKHLPLADFTILANAHYYFLVGDWLDYLDMLRTKTRYCVIVTADKRERLCWASANITEIRRYFIDWEEVGIIDDVPLEGDPYPRKLTGICFKSNLIERVPIESLGNGNSLQKGFYGQLDVGIKPLETRYYSRQKRYRKNKKRWPKQRLERYMFLKVKLYENVKANGLYKAIIIGLNNRILDGNHRHEIMKHLGHKNILIRKA
jgi:hypothetical protein